MKNRALRMTAASMVAGLVLAPLARADDADKIARLEAKLAQLESKLEEQQTSTQRALAQSAAIDAAIADADRRAKFFQAEGFTSGWDNGFQLGSKDGEYTLRPYAEFQFRNVTNYSEGDDASNDNFENGFEVRRLKVGIRGTLFNPDFSYNIRFSADRNGGSVTPDLAYVEYKFADDLGVRLGQFKLNWTHEETISDTRQIAVERSLLNQLVGGTNTQYVQGAALMYGAKDKPFRAEVALTDGDLTSNTNYTDQEGTAAYQDFGVAARAEYKFSGKWDAYNDFTARKNTEADLSVVGAGVDWAQGGDGDIYRMTADYQWENTAGLGAYGAVIYTIVDGDNADAALDNSIGGVAQVNYLLPNANDYEIFGRYVLVVLDEDVNNEDTFHEITVGVNKYIYGHNAKISIDGGWLPNGSPEGASGLGVTNTTENQFVVRAQLQLTL